MNLPFQKDAHEDIIDVGLAAASFIREHFLKKDFTAETKEHDNSLVSFVDRGAEKIITEGLSDKYPQFGFITEEDTVQQDNQKEFYWIIDPLDGTTNFIHGIEEFSVSIALSNYDQEMVWGLVIDVMKGDVFHAAKGQGAWKNGNRINLNPSPLKQSILATGFPYYRYENKKEYLHYLDGFMESCRGIRRCGSAALDMVHVASGIYGGFFEFNLHIWDVAAGAIIVTEAGGVVTDFKLNKETWKSTGHIVAGNTQCHQEMFDKVFSL